MRSVASHTHVQYAALPWRRSEDALQILLITTLNTRRWIIPKGWPLEDVPASECAALEALEEAGVEGVVAAKAMGAFCYVKQRKSGDSISVTVDVFAMEVVRQRRSWAEKHAREIRWCGIDEALLRVREPGLRRLIAKFARDMERSSARLIHAQAVATL